MSVSSFIDSAIYAISPRWGAERIATRQIFAASVERAGRFSGATLEAAEANRLREGKWLGSRLSAEAFLQEDQETTRRNSRELYRNDFVGGAVESRVDHVVGTGFTVQARIKARRGVITEGRAKALNEQLEELYEQIEPTVCRTRKRSLWQKISLIQRCLDFDGEAFVVFSDVGNSELPIPLAVEVIDADRVETPPEKVGDPLCRMGVQYAKDKSIAGYWIRKNHPYDDKEFSIEFDFRPASMVSHLFVEWFPGQSRGLPWMTRALNRAKDGKDLTEAGIIGAQVEACFAGFIKSKTNPLSKALGAATGTDRTRRLQDVRPGSMNYIGADEEIVFSTPNKANAVGTLQEYNNRTIAAGLNWPYEMLMKDWRGVSFSGGRIILHGAKLSTRRMQQLIREVFLRVFWSRMVDEAVIVGAIDLDARLYRDNLHHFRRHVWTPPKWSYALTPGEEVNAIVTAIDNNLMTKAEALAENQQDFEEVMEQRKRERQAEREADAVPNEVAQIEKPPAAPQPAPQQVEQEQEVANAEN